MARLQSPIVCSLAPYLARQQGSNRQNDPPLSFRKKGQKREIEREREKGGEREIYLFTFPCSFILPFSLFIFLPFSSSKLESPTPTNKQGLDRTEYGVSLLARRTTGAGSSPG